MSNTPLVNLQSIHTLIGFITEDFFIELMIKEFVVIKEYIGMRKYCTQRFSKVVNMSF